MLQGPICGCGWQKPGWKYRGWVSGKNLRDRAGADVQGWGRCAGPGLPNNRLCFVLVVIRSVCWWGGGMSLAAARTCCERRKDRCRGKTLQRRWDLRFRLWGRICKAQKIVKKFNLELMELRVMASGNKRKESWRWPCASEGEGVLHLGW